MTTKVRILGNKNFARNCDFANFNPVFKYNCNVGVMMQEHALIEQTVGGVKYSLVLVLYNGRVQGYKVGHAPETAEGVAPLTGEFQSVSTLREAISAYDALTLGRVNED